MQKIMFDDRYCLTEQTLEEFKTQTRRLEKFCAFLEDGISLGYDQIEAKPWGEVWQINPRAGSKLINKTRYRVGEVVAIAQPYKDIPSMRYAMVEENGKTISAKFTKGWSNKMYVKPVLMPKRIEITGLRCERLQSITAEDCEKEGIKLQSANNGWGNSAWHWEYHLDYYDSLGRSKKIIGLTPQECYSYLIDRLSGAHTWENNPWVVVYDYKLLR